jgi:hypothetical protein
LQYLLCFLARVIAVYFLRFLEGLELFSSFLASSRLTEAGFVVPGILAFFEPSVT